MELCNVAHLSHYSVLDTVFASFAFPLLSLFDSVWRSGKHPLLNPSRFKPSPWRRHGTSKRKSSPHRPPTKTGTMEKLQAFLVHLSCLKTQQRHRKTSLQSDRGSATSSPLYAFCHFHPSFTPTNIPYKAAAGFALISDGYFNNCTSPSSLPKAVCPLPIIPLTI